MTRQQRDLPRHHTKLGPATATRSVVFSRVGDWCGLPDGRLAYQPGKNLVRRATQIKLDRTTRDRVENQHRRPFATRQHLSHSKRHLGKCARRNTAVPLEGDAGSRMGVMTNSRKMNLSNYTRV